jgi:hypothetical protein
MIDWIGLRIISAAHHSDTLKISKILHTVEYYCGELIERLQMRSSDGRLILEKLRSYCSIEDKWNFKGC